MCVRDIRPFVLRNLSPVHVETERYVFGALNVRCRWFLHPEPVLDGGRPIDAFENGNGGVYRRELSREDSSESCWVGYIGWLRPGFSPVDLCRKQRCAFQRHFTSPRTLDGPKYVPRWSIPHIIHCALPSQNCGPGNHARKSTTLW